MLGEWSIGHSQGWAQVIKMAATEEDWRKLTALFMFDDYLMTPQTNIDNDITSQNKVFMYNNNEHKNVLLSSTCRHFEMQICWMTQDFLPCDFGLAWVIAHLRIK